MSKPEPMVKVAQKVEDLLLGYPDTRDNDWMLILAYMNINHGLISHIGAEAYAKLRALILASNNMPPAESITRARRRLQQENPMLRGKNYVKRHKVLEPEMRDWVNRDHL